MVWVLLSHGNLRDMFTMQTPRSIRVRSLVPFGVPEISGRGLCPFQLVEAHFQNALPREARVTLPIRDRDGTQACPVVCAERQSPHLDNDSSFQMSLGLEPLEREGRRVSSQRSMLMKTRFGE